MTFANIWANLSGAFAYGERSTPALAMAVDKRSLNNFLVADAAETIDVWGLFLIAEKFCPNEKPGKIYGGWRYYSIAEIWDAKKGVFVEKGSFKSRSQAVAFFRKWAERDGMEIIYTEKEWQDLLCKWNRLYRKAHPNTTVQDIYAITGKEVKEEEIYGGWESNKGEAVGAGAEPDGFGDPCADEYVDGLADRIG